MSKTPEINLRDALFKNLIMNGEMRIAQRGVSFVSPTSGQYLVDRFLMSRNSGAIHTVTQDSDVPTFSQAGYLFQNSLRLNLTTPDTSIAAGESSGIVQRVEGFNLSQIAQKPFTLSFWVKATLPGNYCVAFLNSTEDRTFIGEYTINAASTWEKKVINILASPSGGTWNYSNGIGLSVVWTLAAGTSLQTTAGAWQTGSFRGSASQVNGVNTGATDFRITGVVINEGYEAAPFNLFARDRAAEIIACQRYYEKSFEIDTAPANGTVGFFLTNSGLTRLGLVPWVGSPALWQPTVKYQVRKRTLPILTRYGDNASRWCYNVVGTFTNTTTRNFDANIAPSALDETGFVVENNVSTSAVNGVQGHWTADAEL